MRYNRLQLGLHEWQSLDELCHSFSICLSQVGQLWDIQVAVETSIHERGVAGVRERDCSLSVTLLPTGVNRYFLVVNFILFDRNVRQIVIASLVWRVSKFMD